jgi:hypothetical protein
MRIETLKNFLLDTELLEKYNIDTQQVQNITMTSTEDNIMIVLIKELIVKQAEASSNNIAAAQLNTLLDNRLK